jgi:maleate cis-trans isomerase
MYGWRGRIGLMVPSINTVMEVDFGRMAPPGVSVHTARLFTEREGTFEALIKMEEESDLAARALATCHPGVIVYGCTSGTFIKGPSWNKEIIAKLTKLTGIPTVTTAGSMIIALKACKLKRISVVTPYVRRTNEQLVKFLEGQGVGVLALETFDMLDMFDHATIEPWQLYELARKAYRKGAQGVFIACTQMRALDILDPLEQDLGMPAISATQATMWNALKILGVPPHVAGFGRLMRGAIGTQSRDED